MQKWLIGSVVVLVLFISACAVLTSTPPAQPSEPTVHVIKEECKRALGEQCDATCSCLKPLACSSGTCILTGQPEGTPCATSQQCASGFCLDGICGYPGGEAKTCEIRCPDHHHTYDECQTVCA